MLHIKGDEIYFDGYKVAVLQQGRAIPKTAEDSFLDFLEEADKTMLQRELGDEYE